VRVTRTEAHIESVLASRGSVRTSLQNKPRPCNKHHDKQECMRYMLTTVWKPWGTHVQIRYKRATTAGWARAIQSQWKTHVREKVYECKIWKQIR